MFYKPCSLQSLSQVTQNLIICVFGFSSKLVKLVEKLADLLGLQGWFVGFQDCVQATRLRFLQAVGLQTLCLQRYQPRLGRIYCPCNKNTVVSFSVCSVLSKSGFPNPQL